MIRRVLLLVILAAGTLEAQVTFDRILRAVGTRIGKPAQSMCGLGVLKCKCGGIAPW